MRSPPFTSCRATPDAPAFCFQHTRSCKDTTQPYCVRSSHQASYTLTFLIVKERVQLSELGSSSNPLLSAVSVQPIERWWSWTGSNRRPRACKARALPIELQPRGILVGLDGFEPSTPALSRRCSNQLSYRPGVFSLHVCLLVQPIGCGYSSCGSARAVAVAVADLCYLTSVS